MLGSKDSNDNFTSWHIFYIHPVHYFLFHISSTLQYAGNIQGKHDKALKYSGGE